PAHLGVVRVQDEWASTQVGDPDGERDAGTGGRFVEEKGDGAWTGKLSVTETIEFHVVGEVEHLRLFVPGAVVAPPAEPYHVVSSAAAASAASRVFGRASSDAPICLGVMTGGGASRSVVGATELPRKPWIAACSWTWAEWGPVSVRPLH